MRGILLSAAAGVVALATTGSAQAQGFSVQFGSTPYRGSFYNGGYSGSGFNTPYRGGFYNGGFNNFNGGGFNNFYRGGFNNFDRGGIYFGPGHRYHYQPDRFVPHRDHFHYIPGGTHDHGRRFYRGFGY